jgi:uncharacterized repeat protein (TIGR01451 family)
MSKIDRRTLRTVLASSGVTVAALAALLLLAIASDGRAQSCTDFTVVTSSMPSANWTDVLNLWTPSGSYPGRDTSCDTASDTTGNPMVIVVNTAIPNAIAGLNLSCTSPGCVIDIQPGGSLTLAGPGTIGSGSKLRVSGGTLTLAAGTLTFQSGSQYEFTNGTVDIQNGATMDFTTGSNGVTSGGVMGGVGTLSISGGTLTIGAVVSPGTFSMTAGVLDGPGFLSVTNTLFWDGGTITGSGGTELAGGGTGTLSGIGGAMTLNGRIFNNYGTITYTADPTVPGNGELTLVGTPSLPAAFNTYGTTDIQGDGSIFGGPDTLVGVFPNGIFTKSSGFGISGINAPTQNDSVMWAQSGTLAPGKGTHNGLFRVDSGATILFGASFTTLTYAAEVSGNGDIEFGGEGTAVSDAYYDIWGKTTISLADVTFHSQAHTQDFLFNAPGFLHLIATDYGYPDFIMTGNGTWSAGTIQYDDGTFVVGPNAILTIDAVEGVTTLDTAVIGNLGTINYTADGMVLAGAVRGRVKALSTPSSYYLELKNGSTIFNDGTFDITANAPIVGNADGSFRTAPVHSSAKQQKRRRSAAAKTALRPITTANGHVITNRAHTMGVHASECSCFSGDDIENGDGATLQKSIATGTTDFGPDFGNSGAMKALSGTINFQGDYFQDDGSTTLGPGNIQSAFPMDIEGGIVDGNGTITGDLDNYGEVKPGTATAVGTINISGNFEMGASPGGGAVDIKIANATSFDQLNITGTATLDATFNGNFINGYTPATGTTTWPVIAYATRGSSQFTTVNDPTYPGGTVTHSYDDTSTPNSFDLTAFTPATANVNITNSGPGTANAGDTLTYTVDVSNLGPDPTSGAITVIDSSTGGATPVGGSAGSGWNCSIVSGSIQCTSTSTALANGSSLPTLTFTWTAPLSSATVVNTAAVQPNSVTDPVSSNNSADVTTVVAAADVAITKNGPPTVTLGQDITYTITVSNFGPSGASGVTVSDPTPAGLTPVSVSGGGCSAFPCTIGSLPVGPPVTITAVYNVPVNYSGPSPIVNTATVTSASDPNLSNNSATASTTVAAQADLGITKSGPPSVSLGQNVTYTINVTNSGSLAAANTFVSDPTPAGLTPVLISGGGCSAFPCAVGTISPGGSVAITATYNVPAGYPSATITNTASVSTSSPESNVANNSATAVTPVSNTAVADLSILKAGPGSAVLNDVINFDVIVTNNGPGTAANVVISDPTPSNLVFISNSGGCTTPYPCTIPSLATNSQISIVSRYRVAADTGTIVNTSTVTSSASDPAPGNNTASSTVQIVKPVPCPQAPVLTAPLIGATVGSPITFSWSSVPGATYIVSITGGGTTQTVSTNTNSTTQNLPNGAYSWSVQANSPGGCQATSTSASFSVCNAPGTPLPSVVGVTTTGQTYNVEWTPAEGTTLYELQEAGDAGFTNPTTTSVAGTSQPFTKNISVPTAFFYRVRALAGCSPIAGSFSAAAPIVIIPVPPLGTLNINIPMPAGSKTPVSFPIHVPGLPNITTSFFATVDKPWLSVTPSNGVMPPEGLNFTISADPSTLSDGTWTGTVIVVYGTSGVSGKQALDATPKTSIPVSISLTSPVSPGTLTGPAATAVVIPSVGHLPVFSSQWQSDIRIANTSTLSKKVQLIFSAGSATSLAVKQTTISIDPGSTVAFDDIVRNWFGIGAMNDASNGVLTVQPLDTTGKADLSISKATVASSRTFNSSALGTLGQFIPAVPIASFISKAPGAASILTLQQIAQTDTFHTNLGLVEATGKSASVLVSVFNGAGNKILDLPVTLAAGEQRQLNGFLGTNGITLTNGHIEVQSISGDGKVTAYASVIDNRTTDPLLVSGVPLGGPGATRYVIPGVASLDTGATWRSDVRVFNSSTSPQTATLTLYPTGNPSASIAHDLTIQPGEVKALDDIVHSTFNLTNAGGALHVTTATAVPLVVTARTFNDTAAGTLGQFLQAVTPADAVGTGERSLQLLQMEDSPRYRTNLGLTEVTGKAATAEVTIILPDSKVAPKVSIPLAAFEYRQFAIISSLGLGNVYNARISVRVIDGQGKVTAYGSVIDQKTQDPTFVPAQ